MKIYFADVGREIKIVEVEPKEIGSAAQQTRSLIGFVSAVAVASGAVLSDSTTRRSITTTVNS